MTKRPETFQLDRIATPLGEVLVVFDHEGVVRAFDFADYEERMRRLLRLHYGAVILEAGAAPAGVREAVTDYFGGDVEALKRIPWATGGTAFQRRVWAALTEIPAGRTETYGQLAARIGAPTATGLWGRRGSGPAMLVGWNARSGFLSTKARAPSDRQVQEAESGSARMQAGWAEEKRR